MTKIASNLQIDSARLWGTIHETAKFGATPKGGVRRLTLGPEGKQVRDRADRVPFTYGEFYDYPRMIEFQIGSKWYYLHSEFDEEKDDYPDVFDVYLLPYLEQSNLAQQLGADRGALFGGGAPLAKPAPGDFVTDATVDPFGKSGGDRRR